MFPYINLFGLNLSTYGISTSIGLVLMGTVAFLLGRKLRIRIEDIVIGEIVALIGAVIGAHILYGITNIHYIIKYLSVFFRRETRFDYLAEIFVNYMGGMVFYGGLLGGLGFGALYCKIRGIRISDYSDCFAVGIPLFHGFGRLGCFFSGCCYGIESSFGFTATNAIVESCNHVNRFPVQLLEAGLNVILFFVLLLLFRRGKLNGIAMAVYLLCYSVIRFFDEFLRGDVYRGIWLGLSTSQWISLVIFTVSVVVLICKYKNRKHKLHYIYR